MQEALQDCNEEWRPVVGYETQYLVSNTGRVYSVRSQRELRAYTHHGYRRVCLRKHGEGRQMLVHRLVAEAYLPQSEGRPFVNHKSGIKDNNHLSNLEYVSHAENVRHAVETGIHNYGSRNGRATLNEQQVREIRARRASCRGTELAAEYGCSASAISRAISGKLWRHV